ncbi:MAG: MarR family winged helix-turn-helix transcriptional regulator [Methanomassiliicoccaceae archaeon]|nr:MarR family winged helix-turn-helix transcriptional regulator [Methanomassiliicoccaceae archaeon]
MATREDTYWNSFLPVFFDRMSTIIRKNMTKIVSEHGLTSAHSIYLVALNLQDGQTMVQLSRFLDLDPANTNRVVKTLKEKGFVYDDRKTETSKKYSVYLTESGRELAKTVMTGISDLNNSYFDGIPREDVIRMRNTLIRVLQNMDPDLDKYIRCELNDPYYTYLQAIPANIDFVMIPRRLIEDDYYTQKKG